MAIVLVGKVAEVVAGHMEDGGCSNPLDGHDEAEVFLNTLHLADDTGIESFGDAGLDAGFEGEVGIVEEDDIVMTTVGDADKLVHHLVGHGKNLAVALLPLRHWSHHIAQRCIKVGRVAHNIELVVGGTNEDEVADDRNELGFKVLRTVLHRDVGLLNEFFLTKQFLQF